MKFNHKKCRLIVLLVLFFSIMPAILFERIASTQDQQKAAIFFYNSEININNFISIKAIFDKYLSKFGSFHFQPFDDRKIFEKTFRKTNYPIVMVMSSWHFQSLTKESPLHPILIASRNGKQFFNKILSAKKPINSIKDLSGKVLATAGSVEHSRNLLREMFGKDKMDIISTIKILIVPKDIDALLAVSYNVANAALTTADSLKLIEKINPRLKKEMTALVTSADILRPVAVIKKTDMMLESLEEIVQIMKEMKTNENGRESLSTLSIDGWSDISPEIMSELIKND